MTPEFAKEAGLLERDMPSPHHPLMQNDAEVRNLADLIDARSDHDPMDNPYPTEINDGDDTLDVSHALTFPHTREELSSVDLLPDTTDFDADARTHTPPDDEDDSSYMTRADVEASMLETDPDPNTGITSGDYVAGEIDLDRAPDMTGTVLGVDRGMSTHLPQDLGSGGFQIIEPEEIGDPRALRNQSSGGNAEDDDFTVHAGLDDEFDPDAGRIPTAMPNIDTRDEALDATRQLR